MRFQDGADFRLETADLVLEPLAPRHAPDLLEMGSDPRLFDWLPPAPFGHLDAVLDWIVEAREQLDRGAQIPLAITRAGRALGSTRLMSVHTDPADVEIGYTWLGRPHQRTYVNTAVKRALIGHVFEALGAPRLVLKTDLRNVQSQVAIQRALQVPRNVVLDDVVCQRDSVYYFVPRAEWPRVRDRLDALSRR